MILSPAMTRLPGGRVAIPDTASVPVIAAVFDTAPCPLNVVLADPMLNSLASFAAALVDLSAASAVISLARLADASPLLLAEYDSARRIVNTSPTCCARGVSYKASVLPPWKIAPPLFQYSAGSRPRPARRSAY